MANMIKQKQQQTKTKKQSIGSYGLYSIIVGSSVGINIYICIYIYMDWKNHDSGMISK